MPHHTSPASQIVFLESRVECLEAERDRLRARLDRLRDAVAFLDRCRDDPMAKETGALRDAHEWIESAAREAVQ